MIILRSTVLTTKKRPATVEPEEGVSVIITCSNKAELLKQNLEAFLTQEYPKYEVIVVDECSEDETQDVLSDLQQKYPHLKTTRIFPETKFRRTKKIAINIGVLAAQYDVLLFSEINCKPGSGRWLHAMASYFTPDTAVVIGYSNYPVDGAGGKFRCYFRFLWFWKTMVLNRRGLQVVGNGNNMGYRKKYYLEKRGFQVCCRNYRCRFGEIDIIAREPQRDILCFVEVKTRSSLRKGRPWEAVTPAKIRHLHRTAQHYLSRYRPACSGIRIDAAEILYIDHRFYIRYMENITG